MHRRTALLISFFMLVTTPAALGAEPAKSFPLAAPAGQDSNARQVAPPGAVNQGPFDLSNFSGYRQGDPDYERAINIVHDAAIKAGKKLCGPWAWRDRPDFTCFQAQNEIAQITRGARADLGDAHNTQAKPEVGPFAPK